MASRPGPGGGGDELSEDAFEDSILDLERQIDALSGTGETGTTALYLSGSLAWKKGRAHDAQALFTQAVMNLKSALAPSEFSNEGDTKSGDMVARSSPASRNPLLNVNLRSLLNSDEAGVSDQMAIKYRELDAFMDNIRKDN